MKCRACGYRPAQPIHCAKCGGQHCMIYDTGERVAELEAEVARLKAGRSHARERLGELLDASALTDWARAGIVDALAELGEG